MPLKLLPHRGPSLPRALSEHSQVPRGIRSFLFSENFFFKTRLASKHEKSTATQKHTAQHRTWRHFWNKIDLLGLFFFFCFKGKLTQQIFPLLAFQPHVPAEVSAHLACCSATARKITASLNNGRGGRGTRHRALLEHIHGKGPVSHGYSTPLRSFPSALSKQHPQAKRNNALQPTKLTTSP